MARRVWTIELPEPLRDGVSEGFSSPRKRPHTIELNHNYWTAKRVIRLDGRVLQPGEIRSYGIFGFGSDDLFIVDGHACVVHIRSNGIAYSYDFVVDGVSSQTDEAVEIHPEVLKVVPGASNKMPKWAWSFLLLCPVIGLAAIFLGTWIAFLMNPAPPSTSRHIASTLATVVVLQSIYRVIKVSKAPDQSSQNRITMCLLIVAGMAAAVAGITAVTFLILH